MTWVLWVQGPHSEPLLSALRGREGVAGGQGTSGGVEEEVTGQECHPGISWALGKELSPVGVSPGTGRHVLSCSSLSLSLAGDMGKD